MANLSDIYAEIKSFETEGRCLHFSKGVQCNQIISAHSIQRSNQLGKIVEGGYVYRISFDLAALQKNNGRPILKKISWNKVSTFAGFCKHHDNELFEPIDNYTLEPNDRQVALYSYRSLCREYFTKENAVNTLRNIRNTNGNSPSMQSFMDISIFGHMLGFDSLRYHKEFFDEAIASENFHEFEYVSFHTESPWPLQVSGVLFPQYDFRGKCIQDLNDHQSPFALITFFTAPHATGWSITFCWHVSSDEVCNRFISSLHDAMTDGDQLHNALFRFLISSCENHAIRISWWDSLSMQAQNDIINRISLIAALDQPIPQNYLTSGLNGIVDWNFEYIYTTIEPTQ